MSKTQNTKAEIYLLEDPSSETAPVEHQELFQKIEALQGLCEGLNKQLREAKEQHQKELRAIQSNLDEKIKNTVELESRLGEVKQGREDWKERIKRDLNRIKLKEREIENKHELYKRDFQVLVDSKDKHILELSRQKDALELELESFEEKLRGYNSALGAMDNKKQRLLETLKTAIGILESIDNDDPNKSM